jgi:hypothetical protein
VGTKESPFIVTPLSSSTESDYDQTEEKEKDTGSRNRGNGPKGLRGIELKLGSNGSNNAR